MVLLASATPWPPIAPSSARWLVLTDSPGAFGWWLTPAAFSHIGQVGASGSRSTAWSWIS